MTTGSSPAVAAATAGPAMLRRLLKPSTIRSRVFIFMAGLAALLTVMVIGTVWITLEYRATAGQQSAHARISDLLNTVVANGSFGTAQMQAYVNSGDQQLLTLAQEDLAKALAAMQEAAAELRAAGRGEDAALVEAYLTNSGTLLSSLDEAVRLTEAGDEAGARAAAAEFFNSVQESGQEFAAFSSDEQLAIEAQSDHADTVTRTALYAAIAGGVGGVLILTAAAWLITRSILRPLGKLEESAHALAAGDMTARAPTGGARELAALGHAFNQMTEALLDASRRRELEDERAQAFAALKESEDRWESLVNHTSDIVSIMDTGGVIRYVSPSITPLLGYSPEELTGTPSFELIHADDQPLIRRLFSDVISLRKQSRRAEFRYARKDGGYRTLNAVGSPLTDEAGNLTGVVAISRDVTDRYEMEEQLRFQAHLLNTVGDAVIATDLEGIVLYWNAAAERLYGWPAEEVLGRAIQEVLRTPEGDPGPDEALARVADDASFTVEFVTQRKSGEWVPVEVGMSPLRDTNREIVGAIGDSHDISARKQAEDTIRHMAYHDALTGLPNRLLLKDRFAVATAEARRGRHLVGVISLDLDRFKIINDTLGHSAGDELLVAAAGRLLTAVREGDTVARPGGDEFIVLLAGLTSREEGKAAAARIVEAFRPPFRVAGTAFHATASVGIAFYGEHGADLESAVAAADTAMYAAKDAGRDGFYVFAPELRGRGSERLVLEADLREALQHEEIDAFYQPQVSVRSGEVIGVEALARWRHGSRGILAPADFIPMAEETGLIVPLGRRVLRRACSDAAAWDRAGAPPVRLAVNASLREFTQQDFVATVAQILADTGFPAPRLQIEITEMEALRDVNVTSMIASELGELGITLAIDDFGAGSTSLRYLADLPIRTLKIDQAFIRGATERPEDRAIVSSVLALAHKLGLEVIAEGVETPQQLRFLRENGCDGFQGYLHSRPAPAAETEKLLFPATPAGVR